MSLTDQHTIDPDTAEPRPLMDVLDECLRTLTDAIDKVQTLARDLVLNLEPGGSDLTGGQGPLAACRIQRGQQIVHDGHWWNVTAVERCSIDSVLLTLMRAGISGRPVILDVDPDEVFTVAELF